MDEPFEKQLDTAVRACSAAIAKLYQRQAAFRAARLRVRLEVPTQVVKAELQAALARKEQPV